MTFFKNARDLLLESYDEGAINEDEFLLLYETNYSKNPEFPYKHLKFNLEELTKAECFAEFRCRKTNVKMIGDMLRLPSRFVCHVQWLFNYPAGVVQGNLKNVRIIKKSG